jgi:oligopeptidase A
MTNPLLDFSDLPRFDQIRPEHVAPAMDDLLASAESALATVTAPDFPAKWTSIATVLDVATERLGRAWGAVAHLNSVADTPELRAAFNAFCPSHRVLDPPGCRRAPLCQVQGHRPESLNTEQRQAHRNALRNFVLGGAELTGAARERFAQIQERQAELAQKFSENALDATDAFSTSPARRNLTACRTTWQTALAAAAAQGKDGYKLTLKMPCYLPVMQFARSSALRHVLYRAYVTRASDQAEGDAARFDNSALIRDILALRQEEARLLGFVNFGEVSVVPKMAESPQEVITFLRDLSKKARPYAEKDVADLRAFAAEHLGLADPQPWDWPYISEKLKEARYAFSEQDVKQYFTAPKVLAGLFKIIETLFEVSILPDTAPVWHPSVQFYRIERTHLEGAHKGTQLVGQFYLDQPARNGKRGGAWMDDVRTRWLRPDTGSCRPRWRTWCATLPTAWTASRRC